MQRIGKLWPQFITFENLYLAYLKARKGKQRRDAVAVFSFDLENNLLQLQRELAKGRYQPGEYRQFIIRERKPRLISAAPFRDRVVHHALMNVLEPIFEKRFYYHSYACRPDKGVHRAADKYQQWATRYAYVLKVDIARYFPSIRHDVLKQQLRRMIKDKPVLALLDQVIDASPVTDGVGLPIGNLTSQYFANVYLNDIDHWLKQQQKVPAYCRYVDDLMVLGDNKQQLWQVRDALAQKLHEIGLTLHVKKQTIQRTTERVDVLGYKLSRYRRWLRNDNGYRFQRKLKGMAKGYARHRLHWQTITPRVQSWIGHALHGETIRLRNSVFKQRVFKRAGC
jgi:retron-type reverse transcriptase